MENLVSWRNLIALCLYALLSVTNIVLETTTIITDLYLAVIMIIRHHLVLPVCFLAPIMYWNYSAGVYIPNLSEACYRCLCHVSTRCQISHECTGGYCGPFNISRVYWIDAGKITLPEDDPDRNHAWEDCARNYYCSKRIIEGYLQKFGKDCNGDGVTNCFDYMMVNGNGGYGCTAPLNQSINGRKWLERYEECRHSL